MKILILGANGMLGHSLFSNLLTYNHDVFGTIRAKNNLFLKSFGERIFYNVDFNDNNLKKIDNIIQKTSPDYVINCIGIIKQKKQSMLNMDQNIYINSYLPHLLSNLAEKNNSKFIHFSTDCVFSGIQGAYVESDVPDARDSYGLTKYLGEINNKHSITLRTSIIGHELNTNLSLVDWFLSEKNDEVTGFCNAIFSGLPTCYVAKILNKYILGSNLHGLYHLSVDPIDKYSLLSLVAKIYNKKINIRKDYSFEIDRSLSSKKLTTDSGYNYENWEELIKLMHQDKYSNLIYDSKEN